MNDARGRALARWDVVTAYGEDRLIIRSILGDGTAVVANVNPRMAVPDPTRPESAATRATPIEWASGYLGAGRLAAEAVVRADLLTYVDTMTAPHIYRRTDVPGIEVSVTGMDWRGLALVDALPGGLCVDYGCGHMYGNEWGHANEAGVLGWHAVVSVDGRPAVRYTGDGRKGPLWAAGRAVSKLSARQAKGGPAGLALALLLMGRDPVGLESAIVWALAHHPEIATAGTWGADGSGWTRADEDTGAL